MNRIDEDVVRDQSRLEALRRTELLDSPPEAVFDRLTSLAVAALRVPSAFVSLVDSHRLFFKSQQGLSGPAALARQAPVENSFCEQAVTTGEPVIVADARRDPVFSKNPIVSSVGIVAYAGFPLFTSEGQALGTFCVADKRPHDWTEEEIDIVRVLANSAMCEIELRSRAEELKTLAGDLREMVQARTSELRAAEERQRVLLDVNNAIVTCRDRNSLFTATAEALRRVIPFDRAALVLYSAAKDVFQVLGVTGSVPAGTRIPLGTEWPRHGSRAGWVYDHGVPLLTPDLRASTQFPETVALIKEGILSVVSVPLTMKEKVLGTLNVGSYATGRYGEEQAALLTAIGEQVALAIDNLLAYEEIATLKARLEEENEYLQEEVRTEAAFGDVIGGSPAIRGVLENVHRVAGTDSTVLVTGETGTGKELVVRAIHRLSRRKDKPLVKVNCAALPAGVIESELFGHEKGAFTGALTRKPGRFELADGGTLFLDEIGDLPLELQAKLLRVLQDGEFERVGGTQSIKVNVRLVAATNRDLDRAVREERFRADLFYRLNVFPISIPPLRERLEDVPRLARHFVMLFSAKMGRSVAPPSAAQLERLAAYSWPGNVRELQNVIERAVILSSKGRFELDGAVIVPVAPPHVEQTARSLEDVERRHIVSVLEETGWRVSGDRGAARILGLKRTTLEARMKRLGILRRT